MAITIGSNIASLQAQRRLQLSGNQLEGVFLRLSTGQRINVASDDAAGLAIADSLNADSRIYNQAVRNLNDGLSLLNIADAALAELTNITVRLEELATQSANGVYDDEQRAALDGEAQALSKEFFRITRTTEFNGQKLFTGENPNLTLQAGRGDNAILDVNIGGAIGSGSFDEGSSLNSSGTLSIGFALGDVNGDGFVDVVKGSGEPGNGFNVVLLGTGNGTFSESQTLSTLNQFSGTVLLEDINRDGNLDLLGVELDLSSNDSFLGVRLGNGDGSFSELSTFDLGMAEAVSAVIGDVNGDGNLDLFAGGWTGAYGANALLLGDGIGGFSTAVTTQGALNAIYDVELADLNGDGILDQLSGGIDNPTNVSTVSVRLGLGDGSFESERLSLQGGSLTGDLELIDLNEDGVLDLVSALRSANGFVALQLGNGDGTFGEASTFLVNDFSVDDLSFADVNGDGYQDLVALGRDSSSNTTLSVLLSDTFGGFEAADELQINTTMNLAFGQVDTFDVTGDGVLDILASTYHSVDGGDIYLLSGEGASGVNPLLPFSLDSVSQARQALPLIQHKRELLIQQRGQIGANQSRIEAAINVLQVQSENFRSAESRIRDADIAQETANLTRLQILQQSAAAVLENSNAQPALALQLLRT